MSPNLEEQMPESPEVEPRNDDIHLNLTPLGRLSAASSVSEGSTSQSDSENRIALFNETEQVDVAAVFKNLVPLEYNIRELLVRASSTENLERVTQIKLRVIARDLAMQQLGVYLPALRELILDGSIISSLRDLGDGLRNLKILRVSRCQLNCIDGVFGFECLEELYAADNNIKDLSSCAFLSSLKVLDIRRNSLKHIGSISFLTFCTEFTDIFVEGNAFVNEKPEYMKILLVLLPNVQKIDGKDVSVLRNVVSHEEITSIVHVESESDTDESLHTNEPDGYMFSANDSRRTLRSSRSHQERNREFIVKFPPRVCSSNEHN